jgi:hypothetical protein
MRYRTPSGRLNQMPLLLGAFVAGDLRSLSTLSTVMQAAVSGFCIVIVYALALVWRHADVIGRVSLALDIALCAGVRAVAAVGWTNMAACLRVLSHGLRALIRAYAGMIVSKRIAPNEAVFATAFAIRQ